MRKGHVDWTPDRLTFKCFFPWGCEMEWKREACLCWGRGWVVSLQEPLKKWLLAPGYLSDLGKQEERLKGELNPQPQTRPGWGAFPDMGARPQGQLINQTRILKSLFHLHFILLCIFFFLNNKIHILITLKLIENISTAESLNYFLVLIILPPNTTK